MIYKYRNTTNPLTIQNITYILVNKRNDFFKYIYMLKPKQLFIIIYVDVFVKRVSPYKTNNSILFRSVTFAMIELDI
jgi:hypothetical protein